MWTIALWVGAAALSGFATARVVVAMPESPLRARNYRGLRIPTAGGVAIIAGTAAGAAIPALVSGIQRSNTSLAADAARAFVILALASAFALLGAWDDVSGTSAERGWRAHVLALRRGRATPGALKLAIGGAFAVLAASVTGAADGSTFALNAAIIALSANTWNLFDMRPGRASKFFLVAAIPLLAVSSAVRPILSLVVVCVATFLRFDLRERVMLGDAGANALGAIVGISIAIAASDMARLITLVLLLGMQIAGDRPGLSALIRAIPPLRRFDDAGRVPIVS